MTECRPFGKAPLARPWCARRFEPITHSGLMLLGHADNTLAIAALGIITSRLSCRMSNEFRVWPRDQRRHHACAFLMCEYMYVCGELPLSSNIATMLHKVFSVIRESEPVPLDNFDESMGVCMCVNEWVSVFGGRWITNPLAIWKRIRRRE